MLALWIILLAGVVALAQIDLVRQNVEILWIHMTGQAWKLRGSITTIPIQSVALRQSRRVLVYTPPGYDAPENHLHYPVLYLLHGCPDPGDGWEPIWPRG